MILLVPSRGRPERAATMALSAIGTATDEMRVILIVDADDPTLDEYLKLDSFERIVVMVMPEQIGYTASLNAVARDLWDQDVILGAFGDDVLFRTAGWDRKVAEALAKPGIAYGDDLIHGQNHPSAVWMSSIIARTLGWLALPATTHQWADDAWKRLGQKISTHLDNRFHFLPDVIVEHMHPAVEKAEWDDTYRAVFDSERAKRDYDGFTAWAEGGDLEEDAAKVRTAIYYAERDKAE